jgi:hypothetical protein
MGHGARHCGKHSDRFRSCWKWHLRDSLQETTLAARLVATDDDLRDFNVGIDNFEAKLVDCIKQARLFLTL